MQPLSIILVFVFLGSLVLLGAAMVGFGILRLQRQARNGNAIASRTLFVSLDVLLMALGLLLSLYGVVGAYRIVWGT